MRPYTTHPIIFDDPHTTKVLVIVIVLTALLTMFSCSSSRPAILPVHEVHTDTLYLSKIQYDSVFVGHEVIYEPLDSSSADLPPFKGGPGRVFDVTVEYRYKLLRDTIYNIQHDSIPYMVTVNKEVEVTRPLSLFDILSRFSLVFVIISIGLKLRKLIPQ